MDLVQMREEILSRNVTPMDKARTFIRERAVWKLSKAQWGFFTFPLLREVEDAIIFLELPGEQQQQFKELEAHLNKYIEDKFAKNRLGHLKTH